MPFTLACARTLIATDMLLKTRHKTGGVFVTVGVKAILVDMLGVKVSVEFGVCVGVAVSVSVGVIDAVTVKDGVIEGEAVCVHVGVLVAVGVALGISVFVDIRINAGWAVAVGSSVTVGLGKTTMTADVTVIRALLGSADSVILSAT